MGSLRGQTYLVTGSTDGIGQHTALKLAQAGANVILHGRNPQRVEAAKRAAEQAADKAAQGGQISAYVSDLSQPQQIKQFAADVRKDHPAINVLINNAGVFQDSKQLSKDGNEMTWQVNVLAPYILTALLLDRVTDRIVNVASISAASSIDFNNLNQEQGFSSHNAYSLSKLATMLFTAELANQLKQANKNITVNCLDPGTVNTKMLYTGWGPCGIDIKDANDEYFLATSPSVAKTTGPDWRHVPLCTRILKTTG
ncbi:hypothetical protein WJX72_009527 [[Myrmecia] bisecta]|uniref:Ketoreductase domain-containing protein n=1 Tax=[Myrmecia] bisecta TaxID=41462 RepID=A0AAW1Q3Q6_9CHLO